MRLIRRFWLFVGLGALTGALGLALVSGVGAQTPDQTSATQSTGATPLGTVPTQTASTPTPGPEVKTLVRIAVDPAIQPIPEGDEFEAHVFVDDVEHLAGFDFTITFDPERIEPSFTSQSDQNATGGAGTPVGSSQRAIKTVNMGQFLTSSGRSQDEVLCSDAKAQGDNSALVTCSLLGAPVCAGGQPGVSGSGDLGAIVFKSKGGGVTTLELSKSDLVADDIAPPCDISEEGSFDIVAIPHRSQGATIELAKNSSSNTTLIVVIVVVVVAAVAVAGGGGYLIYRRRQAGGTS